MSAPPDPDTSPQISFLAGGGDGYFDRGLAVELETGLLLRDVVEDALRARGSLAPPGDERFVGAP